MKFYAVSVAAVGVVATDPIGANVSSYPACDFGACSSYAGSGLKGYPATCYASKACGTMDCSTEYKIKDRNSMCNIAAKDRYNECQSRCDSAASGGHSDWTNDCRHGCGYWGGSTDCSANAASGDWISHEVIQGEVKYTMEHGTAKKHSESKTNEWSKSVTSTVGAKFSFASASVSTKIAHDTSSSYSNEWSSSTTTKYSVTFPNSDSGKQLWQYVININDDCSHNERTMTKDYALTAGRFQKPCCPAGYGAGDHKQDYQACHSPAKKASWCSSAEYFTLV
jgi:hypothetical protein